jgi:hypothetical protein
LAHGAPPVFISSMKRALNLPAWLWLPLAFRLGATALVADVSAGPYQAITSRNVFGLTAARTEPPEPPRAPLPKVDLVGISTFGGKSALLNVHLPADPPEPARLLACILKVGQREGPITVLEIDEVAGSVKVDNAGTVMLVVFGRPRSQPSPPELPPLPVRMTSRR